VRLKDLDRKSESNVLGGLCYESDPLRLRAKLLKIGAVIIRNTHCVRIMHSSAYPYQEIVHRAAFALRSP